MKNVVVCLSLVDKQFEGLKKIKDLVSLPETKITLLHVWNNMAYEYPGGMIVPFYPDEEQSKKIESQMKKVLEDQYDSFAGLPKENFETAVFSAPNTKEEAVRFLEEKQADLVVCLTPEKKGIKSFFHSSFTNYLAAHAPCDVLAVRV